MQKQYMAVIMQTSGFYGHPAYRIEKRTAMFTDKRSCLKTAKALAAETFQDRQKLDRIELHKMAGDDVIETSEYEWRNKGDSLIGARNGTDKADRDGWVDMNSDY